MGVPAQVRISPGSRRPGRGGRGTRRLGYGTGPFVGAAASQWRLHLAAFLLGRPPLYFAPLRSGTGEVSRAELTPLVWSVPRQLVVAAGAHPPDVGEVDASPGWIALVALAACSGAAPRGETVTASDRSHDFDFHIGTWRTHVRLRPGALSGAERWVEYDGTTVVRPVWNGRASLVELVADGVAGHLELLSLRLYDPAAATWALHVGNASDGSMSPPVTGRFHAGRGEFVGRETIGGAGVLVRFTISEISETSCHFEQALSPDDGRTWVVNWIATDTRVR